MVENFSLLRLTKQGRGQEKEGKEYGEKKSHRGLPEISIEPYPTPVPSNPQHNPERPNPTKETRPPLTTDREGFREWVMWGVSQYFTHSMRETKSSVIYEKTKNVDAVRRLLGQSSVTATSAYLGVSDNSALELARSINV